MFFKATNICGYLLIILAFSQAATGTSDHVSKSETPIIINTQLQNYEQPTLNEYKDCIRNRDECMNVCAGVTNREKCESQCLVCPELFDHDVVVQGVNDTAYVPSPPVTSVNTTNVIRLTNDIHNIIQTDIRSQNVNNVTLHQNVSHVGGKFGLGYNEHGSCCYVFRKSRKCESRRHQRHLTHNDCETKRHRLCGERCKARVMFARRVRKCEDELRGPCEEHVEYVPKRQHTRHDGRSTQCRYIGQQWPYVSCGQGVRRGNRLTCSRCLKLPYGYVLNYGLPMQCNFCFNNYMGPYMPTWYPPYTMNYPINDIGDAEGMASDAFFWDGQNDVRQPNLHGTGQQTDDDGWVLESKKCRLPDGTLSDVCPTDDEDTQQSPPSVTAGSGDDGLDDYQNGENNDYDNDINDLYYDDGNSRSVVRRRRRTFIRSAYSRRHRADKI